MTFIQCIVVSQLLLATVCNGYVNNFRINALFADLADLKRPLLVDITASESFVLNSSEFSDYGRGNVYKPTASDTFKNLSLPISIEYSEDFNSGSSEVNGFIGQDELTVIARKYRSSFGIATSIKGEKNFIDFDGEPNAGRLGLARKAGVTSLAKDMLEKGSDIICLEIGIARENKYIRRTTTGLGGYIYKPNQFRTKVSALENPQGLWQTNVQSFSVGGSTSRANLVTTFSSTLNGITVPSALFPYVLRRLGAKFDRENSRYLAKCANEIPIKIVINGTEFDIRFDAYTEQISETDCVVKIRSGKERSLILGVPFLVNNGVCFDNESGEIHFYDASWNASIMVNGTVKTHNGVRAVVETVFEQ